MKRPPRQLLALAHRGLSKPPRQRTPAERRAIRQTRAWRLRRRPGVRTNRAGWALPSQEELNRIADEMVQAELLPQQQAIERAIASSRADAAAQQAQLRAQAQAQQQAIQRLNASIMPYLQAAIPAVQQGYQGAVQQIRGLGQGFSGDLRDTVNQQADQDAALLAQFGAPQGAINQFNATAGDSGAGNVLYGLGSFIPGSTLAREGAAAGALAASYPAVAAATSRDIAAGFAWQAQQAMQQAAAQAASQLRDLQSQLVDLQAQVPGLRAKALEDAWRQAYNKLAARFALKKMGFQTRAAQQALHRKPPKKPRERHPVSVTLSKANGYLTDTYGNPILRNGKPVPYNPPASGSRGGRGKVGNRRHAIAYGQQQISRHRDDFFVTKKTLKYPGLPPGGPNTYVESRVPISYQKAVKLVYQNYAELIDDLLHKYAMRPAAVRRIVDTWLRSIGINRPRRRAPRRVGPKGNLVR